MPWIYVGYARGLGNVYVNKTLTSVKIQRYAGYRQGKIVWRYVVRPLSLWLLRRLPKKIIERLRQLGLPQVGQRTGVAVSELYFLAISERKKRKILTTVARWWLRRLLAFVRLSGLAISALRDLAMAARARRQVEEQIVREIRELYEEDARILGLRSELVLLELRRIGLELEKRLERLFERRGLSAARSAQRPRDPIRREDI